MIKSISLIGSGNVATHLGQGFFSAGITIDSIYSRSLSHAEELAAKINASGIDQMTKLNKTSDLYLICVSDDAIGAVLSHLIEIIESKAIVAHTSGSTSSIARTQCKSRTGVFYPLQSFNKKRNLDLARIPILITAEDPETREELVELADKISSHHQIISDKERLLLHVAAVFANNFSNHLFTIAEDISKKHDLDFDLLRPLISETVARIENALPSAVQTGPAIRNDLKIIDKHIQILKNNPAYSAVYSLMSQSIIGHYQSAEKPDKEGK